MLLKSAHRTKKITKNKNKMDLNSIKTVMHVDVIRVKATDKDGATVFDANVRADLVVRTLELLNKSSLPDSAQIWIMQMIDCKDIQPVINEFLTCVQSTRFPFLSLTFQNDWGVTQERCSYDAECKVLNMCFVTDPSIFQHQAFRCGKFDRIRLSGNSTPEKSMETTLKTIEGSGLLVKGVEPGVTSFIYI